MKPAIYSNKRGETVIEYHIFRSLKKPIKIKKWPKKNARS